MMKRMMTRFFAAFYALVLAYGLTAAPNAHAISIQGSLGFVGAWRPLTMGTPSMTIAGADSVDNIQMSDTAIVVVPEGDFSGLAGSMASYHDFTFNPFTPVASLVSAGGFTFDLNSLMIEGQDANHLDLSGMGVIRAAGFDDTLARWSFSGDTASPNVFVFSSTIAATPIPEPTTLLLLGVGLAALGVVRRRTR